jgi:hypothetical protein
VNALFANDQQSNIEQICVESCDKAIGQENDHLKLEVKRLKQEVMMLKKQAKAQPTQDNHRNMMNKLKKRKNRDQVCFSTTSQAYSTQEAREGQC